MNTKALVAAAVLIGSAPAMAETWDMATPYGDATFHTQNIRQFAEDVKEATDGKVEIVVHSGGSLFPHPEIKNAVRSGQIPIGEFFLSRLSNENSAFEIDSLPGLATTYDEAEKLWEAQEPVVTKLLEAQGLKPLYSVAWPTPGLYTKFQVEDPSDLSGLRFRAYNATLEEYARNAGMAPVQIEAVDIPQAFSTGAVDAMITSATTGANSKAWDFLSHYAPIESWVVKNIVVVNAATFDALDPEVQQAILDAAAEAETRGWEMSKAETAAKTAELEEHGITVYEPSPALAAGLKEVGAKVLADWQANASPEGQEVISAYQNQ